MPEIAFYLFIEDQIFASQEIWWVKLTPLWVTFSLPISCKHFKIPSVSETILTLFSLFFGGPGLRHSSRFIQHSKTVQFPKSDQGWGRDFTGEADSITGQLLVTYLLHTVQDPFCTATQFSFENSFHTPLFVFWWFKIHSAQQDSPVSKIRSRLRKRLYGWGWLHYRSAIGHLSLTHSSRSILHSDTVQFRKQFSHSSLCFLVDHSLSITDQGWGRDFMGEVDSKAGQLLVTYLLHTVQDPFCTATQFSFENSFHTLLFVFWWTKS